MTSNILINVNLCCVQDRVTLLTFCPCALFSCPLNGLWWIHLWHPAQCTLWSLASQLVYKLPEKQAHFDCTAVDMTGNVLELKPPAIDLNVTNEYFAKFCWFLFFFFVLIERKKKHNSPCYKWHSIISNSTTDSYCVQNQI